jgi:hypothetical protein
MDVEQMKREMPLWMEALKIGLEEQGERKGRKVYGREESGKIIGGYDVCPRIRYCRSEAHVDRYGTRSSNHPFSTRTYYKHMQVPK